MMSMPNNRRERERREDMKRRAKHRIPTVTEYCVWHPEYGLEICFSHESMAHDHLNGMLDDEELFDQAKVCRVVPVNYIKPEPIEG